MEKLKREVEFLKALSEGLRLQVSCLTRECIEKDNEIWNLKGRIEHLEKHSWETTDEMRKENYSLLTPHEKEGKDVKDRQTENTQK